MATIMMDRMQFLDQIKKRQERIQSKLEFRNHGLSVNTLNPNKTLSKGCLACKSGTWWCLYVGHKCNLDCKYCPQGSAEYKKTLLDDPRGMQRLWIEDIKLGLKMVKPGTITGVSYSGGEPFLFLNKIIDMSTFISENFGTDIYQWVYTNGILVTNNKLKILYNCGIQEIRFHLGATNFNKDIVDKLEYATKIFKYVTIETPGTPELKEWLIDKKGLYKLQEYGIHQINIAELYLTGGVNHAGFENVDSYSYTSMSRGQHISPLYSRNVTYDIIEYVLDNNINIIINDCSHESRDAQLMTRELNKDRLTQMY